MLSLLVAGLALIPSSPPGLAGLIGPEAACAARLTRISHPLSPVPPRSPTPVMKLKGRAGFAKKRRMLLEDAMAGNPRHKFSTVGGKSTPVKLVRAVTALGGEGEVVMVKPSYASFLVANGLATLMTPGMLQRSRKQERLANETPEEREAREAKLQARRREDEEQSAQWAEERKVFVEANGFQEQEPTNDKLSASSDSQQGGENRTLID